MPPLQVAGQGQGRADKAGALAVFGGLYGGLGVEVALVLPEVRPGAAKDGVEITDLHDFLATFAHEGEAGIEVEYFDAIIDAGQLADLSAHPDGAIHLSLAERVKWPSSCH